MNDNTRIRIAVPAHLYESVKKQLTLKEAIGSKNFTYKDKTGKEKFVTANDLKDAKSKVEKFGGDVESVKEKKTNTASKVQEAKQNFGAGFTAVKEKKAPSESKPKVEGTKAPKTEGDKTEKTIEERLGLLEKLVKAMSKGKLTKDEGMENEIGYEKGNQKPDGEDDVNLADSPTNDKKDK